MAPICSGTAKTARTPSSTAAGANISQRRIRTVARSGSRTISPVSAASTPGPCPRVNCKSSRRALGSSVRQTTSLPPRGASTLTASPVTSSSCAHILAGTPARPREPSRDSAVIIPAMPVLTMAARPFLRRPAAVRDRAGRPSSWAVRAGPGEQGQNVADRRLLAGRFPHREMRLDLVAVPAALFLLDDVAGLSKVSDDSVSASLGNADAGRDVAQPHARVVCYAQQHPGVVGKKTPAVHT